MILKQNQAFTDLIISDSGNMYKKSFDYFISERNKLLPFKLLKMCNLKIREKDDKGLKKFGFSTASPPQLHLGVRVRLRVFNYCTQ